MKLKAYAKANLILKVIGNASNNYHKLQMLNVKINIYDEIDIVKNNDNHDNISIISNSYISDKLIKSSLDCFRSFFHIVDYYDITIKKNIPLGAGLGGGSCDVGAILKHLSKEHNVDIYKNEFINIIKTIGADIPYSLYNNPAIVTGIGEIIEPVDLSFSEEFICLYPNIIVSTKEIFERNWVISEEVNMNDLVNRLNSNDLSVLNNDLQDSCCIIYKEIANIINEISSHSKVVMSGSGSSILIFDRNIDKVFENLRSKYKNYVIKKVSIIKE